MSFTFKESTLHLNHRDSSPAMHGPRHQWQTALAVEYEVKHWPIIGNPYVPRNIAPRTGPKFHFAASLHVIHLGETSSQTSSAKPTLRTQTVSRRPPVRLFRCAYASSEPGKTAAHSPPIRTMQSDGPKSREDIAMA